MSARPLYDAMSPDQQRAVDELVARLKAFLLGRST
jgi:hypothetical protein